jgi:hypothetical protein
VADGQMNAADAKHGNTLTLTKSGLNGGPNPPH